MAGRVVNSKRLSACIREACERLQKMSGLKVHRVYANIDTLDLRTKTCEQKLSIGRDSKIKKIQVEQAINSIISSNLSLDRRLIHTGIKDFCRANEVNLKIAMVSALIPTINRFTKCIRDAGLILEDLVPSCLAQAEVFFKENILIDFGAGLTKLSLFEDRLVRDMVILPLGAQNITEDIAAELKVSFECAEQLKIRYGRVLCKQGPSTEKIIVRSRVVQLRRLYEVISLRVDSFLQDVKKALSGLNYEEVPRSLDRGELSCDLSSVARRAKEEALAKEDKRPAGIIVTGGGAMLEGFLERVEATLERPVKMGFLSLAGDSRIQAQNALYATSIGLILFGLARTGKLRGFYSRRKFSSFINIIGNLYREYF